MFMQNWGRLTDLENKLVVTKGIGGGGRDKVRGMGLIDKNYMYKVDKQQRYTV